MKRISAILILLIGTLSLQAQGQSEVSFKMRWFGQTERWEDKALGDSKVITIGTHGCALTAASMVLDYYGVNTNPERLNRWLLKNNGFEEGWDDVTGEYLGHVRFKWDTPLSGCSEIGDFVRYDFSSGPADLDVIRSYLDKEIPVIAEVLRPGGIQHFVVLNGYRGDDFLMKDPLDESTQSLNEKYKISDQYGSGPERNIFGLRIYIPADH